MKKYLIPPSEDAEEENSTEKPTHSEGPKIPIFDEDEIYKNAEFRTLLSDCITLLSDGRTIMDELYRSVCEENGIQRGAEF